MSVKKILLICMGMIFIISSGCKSKEEKMPRSDFSEEAFALRLPEGILHGTLMFPDTNNKDTAVILIPGSGPTDRNGNNPQAKGNNHLFLLAEALAEKGYTTLRYDKRGIGQSKKLLTKERELTFDQAIDDVLRISEELITRGFSNLILLGHSEGALIAEAAAVKKSYYKALILASGSALSADKLILNQLKDRDQNLADLALPIVTTLKKGEEVPEVPASLFSVFRPSVQPYLISWFSYDPVDLLGMIDVPVLIIHGDLDIQVPVSDAATLYEASSRGTLKVIHGMNHILKESPEDREGNLATYNRENLPLHEDFVNYIIEFLEKL